MRIISFACQLDQLRMCQKQKDQLRLKNHVPSPPREDEPESIKLWEDGFTEKRARVERMQLDHLGSERKG